MLTKIIKIKNVGRFENASWQGGNQLGALSLVFAENSRGKSTTCEILRSLRSGNPDGILGRKRINGKGEPEVELLIGGSKVTFSKGVWSGIITDVEVFDTAYVHTNVYAGDVIDHDHKKNLYRVIVGEAGIKLANRVDDLDGVIKEASALAKAKREAVIRIFPSGTDLFALKAVPYDPDVESKLAAIDGRVATAEAAAKRDSEIKAKKALNPIALPVPSAKIGPLVQKTMANLAAKAEGALKTHLAQHTKGATQAWISEGFSYTKEGECPYCAQSTTGLGIVASYQSLFDKAYADFKSELDAEEVSFGKAFGPKAASGLAASVSESKNSWDFWAHLDLTTGLSFDTLGDCESTIEAVGEAAAMLLRAKKLSLTDAIPLSKGFGEAVGRLEALKPRVDAYNSVVAQINARVDKFKEQHAAADIMSIKAERSKLALIALNQKPETIAAVNESVDADRAKQKLEEDKMKAKADLDAHSQSVLKAHDKRINELLGMFGAGFSIGQTAQSFVGGRPSSKYTIVINGTPVELGDERTSSTVPSFRNTLSSGDRSTLALAFFISQLERQPTLKDKIVIFDDPFTSQDRSRRAATISLVKLLAAKAKQVIVLSHDPMFLRGIWDQAKSAVGNSCFQLMRMGDGTIIGEWDVEAETASDYAKYHKILWDYEHLSTGLPLDVAKTIRPVLEGYLRLRLPHSFAPNEWLGDMIAKIRKATPGAPEFPAQVILPEVERVNDFSKEFHHSSASAAVVTTVDANELLTFVNATLTLVGEF